MWVLARLRSRQSAALLYGGCLLFSLALSGCKKDPPEPLTGLRIDDRCPGAAHCTGTGDGVLHVGASKKLINPTLVETVWDDANTNNLIDAGESFTDTNANGVFDATWIAGFGMSRPAIGFNDELSVRAVALRWNDITVVIAYLDTTGYLIGDMDLIRARPDVAALDVDKIIIGSTHNHEGADVIGVWGQDETRSGKNPVYQQLTHDQTAAAIVEAVGALTPAQMKIATTQTVNAQGSTLEFAADGRDPIIYDPTMTLLQFVDATNPAATIATLVNWGSHPEYIGERNNLLSADFPHWMREAIEAGVGGMAMYIQGPIGGQIGPRFTAPLDSTGTPVPDPGIPKAQALGESLGAVALAALGGAVEVADPALAYRTGSMFVRFDNELLQAALLIGLFDRELFHYDATQPLSADNAPFVSTRTTYLQVGNVAMITAPGELFPELWIGGYDGSYSWGLPIVTETENAPDLAAAPAPPYLAELMLDNPGVDYAFVAGYAEDYLGYIVPAYNFVLDEDRPYFEQAAGQHYEETVSWGPLCEAHIHTPMLELAGSH